jgi:DNA-binding IclR family transcriptional regulator
LILLRYLASQGEGATVNFDEFLTKCQLSSTACETALANLVQRELVELLGHGYHFQVELIRRWFV